MKRRGFVGAIVTGSACIMAGLAAPILRARRGSGGGSPPPASPAASAAGSGGPALLPVTHLSGSPYPRDMHVEVQPYTL